MNQMLAFGFSLILSLAAVEGLRCHRCYRIREDNTCPKQAACEVPDRNFCFVQRISKGGNTRRIHRGCTGYCSQAIRFSTSYIKFTFCCKTDFCNRYHAWQFY